MTKNKPDTQPAPAKKDDPAQPIKRDPGEPAKPVRHGDPADPQPKQLVERPAASEADRAAVEGRARHETPAVAAADAKQTEDPTYAGSLLDRVRALLDEAEASRNAGYTEKQGNLADGTPPDQVDPLAVRDAVALLEREDVKRYLDANRDSVMDAVRAKSRGGHSGAPASERSSSESGGPGGASAEEHPRGASSEQALREPERASQQ